MQENPNIQLGDKMKIAVSGELGVVTAIATYLYSNDPRYCLTYKSADGKATENWFHAGELAPV